MSCMLGWIRIAGVWIGMALVGIFAAYVSDWLISVRGTLGPTAMQATSPTTAIFAVVLVSVIGALIGSLVAKFSTTNSGRS